MTGGLIPADLRPVLASPIQSCHDVRVATPDLQRLADRVKRRRLELNLSQKRAAGTTGMSKDTWIRVEKGLPVQPSTYDRIEETLRWTVGSCRKILDGGEPVPLDSDGEVEFAAVPVENQEAAIRQAVQDAMVVGTDLNASKIREVNELVIGKLRERGILPDAN